MIIAAILNAMQKKKLYSKVRFFLLLVFCSVQEIEMKIVRKACVPIGSMSNRILWLVYMVEDSFVSLIRNTNYTGQQKKTFFKRRSNFIHIMGRNDVLNTMLPSDFPKLNSFPVTIFWIFQNCRYPQLNFYLHWPKKLTVLTYSWVELCP